MAKISFITDSTAYLHEDFVQSHHIKVIPLNLHWSEAVYKDNVDMTPEEFYKKIEHTAELPTTSQPSAGEFLDAYKEMADGADAIMVPLISSGISGTVDSALVAAKEFDTVPVHVIDSKVTAAGLALLVKALVKKAEEGAEVKELLELADAIIQDLHVYFMVDTLKFLHKGGRIGGASAFLGSALDVKPILYLTEEGKIDGLEKVRTKKKAIRRLIELAVEKANGKHAYVGVNHAVAEDEAEDILKELEEKLSCADSDMYIISPVIGTHAGPGTVGITVHTVEH